MDSLVHSGVHGVLIIGKEKPGTVCGWRANGQPTGQVEAWAEPGREPMPRVELEVASGLKNQLLEKWD